MSLSINTNIGSFDTQRLGNISKNLNSGLEKAKQRLTEGVKTETMSIATIYSGVLAQSSATGKTARDTNNGTGVLQVAAEATDSVLNDLEKLRSLAVSSSREYGGAGSAGTYHPEIYNFDYNGHAPSAWSPNSRNTAEDRAIMQKDADRLTQELDRIATNTTFMGAKLFDNTQVSLGTDPLTKENKSISFGKIGSSDLFYTLEAPEISSRQRMTGQQGGYASAEQAKSELGNYGAITGSDTLVVQGVKIGTANADAGSKAAAINSAMTANGLDVKATAKTSVYVDLQASDKSGVVTINGTSVTLDFNGKNTDSVAAEINKAGISGVVASTDASTGKLVLTSNGGSDIMLGNSAEGTAGFAKVGTTAANGVTLSSNNFQLARGELKLSGGNGAKVSLGGNATKDSSGAAIRGVTGSADSLAKLNGLGKLDISSQEGAIEAIGLIDAAINKVKSTRSQIDQASTFVSNVATAMQRQNSIQDAQRMVELSSMTSVQITRQPPLAMLSMANATQQMVLSLFK